MFKKVGLLSVVVTVFISCYPMGTFQGPGVLEEGEETVGIGFSWMTNATSLVDTTTTGKTAFVADGSLLFRRGFSNNTEIGLKFVGRPWANGSTLIDGKWQALQKPFLVAVGFGISYWSADGIQPYVGYHPAVFVGEDKLFFVAQYNYSHSVNNISKTTDLLVGKRVFLEDGGGIILPFFGLHRAESDPANVFYSLGFGFSLPLETAFSN